VTAPLDRSVTWRRPDTTGAEGVATVVADPGDGERPARRTGYEYLAPLFVERAALPDGHPRRSPLRTELIAGHMPVARHIARKYGHRGENHDDLQQVASMGLVLAVDRFEPGRGIHFLSFAVPTITGEVLRYFRDRTATIRVPRRLRALQSMIYDAAAELGQRNGRPPRPSEIAHLLGMPLETVLDGLAAQATAHTVSLDEPAADDGQGNRGRFDNTLGRIEPEFDLVEQRETLAPLLAALPERERRIVLLRFFGGLTQTEIGVQLGISQMHVSRLLSRTLAELRHRLAAD
jgi:RNA polymerase sigma-B factor